MRLKTCKICGTKFEPRRPLDPTCSFDCAILYGLKVMAQNQAKREREKAKAHREAKQRLKTRRDWMREAQAAFNRYIRLRDTGQPCISCGRHHGGQYHAGHYLSVGARPELRFDERNVNLQCAPCNNHLSGNIVLYRQGLIQKIGLAGLEWLEGPHEPKHYSIADLTEIKAQYKEKARELERENND